ncbi:MAG: MFS transporter [Reyranella sp.]|uniref:MFS transporter n=1 Tax=Reyranella sp. TaxID=1929291 RepID=UPI0011FEDE66|nr:MFS transporter [Reyranella sp.]TAJ39702.1 MAG: MFS transporter [Reyranella sp.]
MTTSWGRISLLYGIGVLSAGQLGIVPPLVPALQRDLGLSLAMAGMAVSIITLVGAVLGLLAGGWSERVGHARALRIGILTMASAAALCAASHDATTLLAARGLAGIGYLLVVVAGPSLMASTSEPRHHAFTLSLWGTFVPVGIAIAGLVAAGFADRAGWRMVFAGDAVVLALALIVALIVARGAAPDLRAPQPSPSAVTLRWLGPAVPLSLGFFCFALLFLALAGLLPTYLVERCGLAVAEAGRFIAIATAFGIAGSLLAAWMMRRGVLPGMLIAVGLITSTVIAAFAFSAAAPVPLAVTGFAVSFALGGLVPAAAFASVPLIAVDPRAIGPINGLLAQAGSLGSLAGPPLLALWVEWAGWSLAPVLLLAVAAIGAASALVVAAPRR